MRIERQIRDYLVFSGDSILEALQKINGNMSRIVFVVEENGTLVGAVSDGDFRRWITASSEIDLNREVDLVMNKEFFARNVKTPLPELRESFTSVLEIIPLLDDNDRFVAIARKSLDGFQVGTRVVSEDAPALVIAEIGNNHNGDVAVAKRLVDLSVEAGADCVKFQLRDLESLYTNKGQEIAIEYDLGSQYTLELLQKHQLTVSELFKIFDYCLTQGIPPLCTPWDIASVVALEKYGVEAYKVASADLTNLQLLEAIGETGKPVICSTGMSRESEIREAAGILHKKGTQYAFLHCNSTYPTPLKDVNLNYLPRLRRITGTIVGYSGHERGYSVPVAAVALGAKIIEKHLTLDKNMEGNDHKVSLLPDEFSMMVRQIREVEESMGQSGERQISQGEMINRENLAKSLVASCHINIGDIISRDMIKIQSPGVGLQPNRVGELVGMEVKRTITPGEFFYESDVAEAIEKKANYAFTRPYGIPVRYHDYKTLTEGVALDFVEFHLSYHDLELDPKQFLSESQNIGFAVHCPELFAGDHILDLSSQDEVYRSRSMQELGRVIELTQKLRRWFPATKQPVVVINAGGWTKTGFLDKSMRASLYGRVQGAIEELATKEVQIAIQTMPPFPWHFGGQSYHNLFVDPSEIAQFSEESKIGICLDVSHSKMACNYYRWNFAEFLSQVLPYSVHLHIVDAKGIDGEGIPIGKGDVDFKELKIAIDRYAPNVPFIPEVWQGHKNKGEGFWKALTYLEQFRF